MRKHHLTKLWQHLKVNKGKPEVTESWKFGLRLLFHCGDFITVKITAVQKCGKRLEEDFGARISKHLRV